MGNLINIYRFVGEQCSGEKQTPTFPYVLRDKNSIICTLAKMSISLKIPYRKNDTQVRIEI